MRYKVLATERIRMLTLGGRTLRQASPTLRSSHDSFIWDLLQLYLWETTLNTRTGYVLLFLLFLLVVCLLLLLWVIMGRFTAAATAKALAPAEIAAA